MWIAFTIANDSVVPASVDSLDFGLVDINSNITLLHHYQSGCADKSYGKSGFRFILQFYGVPMVEPALAASVVNVIVNTKLPPGPFYLDTLTLNHDSW